MKNKTLTILLCALWLVAWSGYNTGIARVLSSGFPHSTLDLIHGVRAFFPILAGLLAIIILFWKKSISWKVLLTPLGLLLIYAIIGIIASLFSKNLLEALYWAMMYLSVILVMWLASIGKDSSKYISNIIKLNWVIASVLAIFLMLFFLIQPGMKNSLSIKSLIYSERPYEGIGGVSAEINTFGMSGTRPTGLGRYAGVMAIVSLCWLLFAKKSRRIIYLLFFALSLLILLFSKGKTEIIAFIAAFIFVIYVTKLFRKTMIVGLLVVVLASLPAVIISIPSANNNIGRFGVRTGTLTLSSRMGVWAHAWNLFLKNPLFGLGFYADKSLLTAHNTILHALVQAGIAGTIPFLLAFAITFMILIRLLKNPKGSEKERYFLITITAAFVFFVVRGIAESMAIYSADWLFVAPIIAYAYFLNKEISAKQNGKRMDFAGNEIDVVRMPEALEKISYWIKNEKNKTHWVAITGMHGIVQAEKHADFKFILDSADLFLPDGISLVWLARLNGFDIKKRIPGPDFMKECLKASEEKNYKNFFYGDTENTLKKMQEKFPRIKSDFYSPPFRALIKEEDEEIINKINSAKPDILWVGLGLPKQEKWIYSHKDKLNVPVIVAVGAAFKFLSGSVNRAPEWVGNIGFEWLWRLVHEPKTVWKRVFIDMPIFFKIVARDQFFW